ncbi:MAG: asparaginase [Nitriliruptorales bacterium]|nr:asparaginase [Nitriliruptorales bacterium]
MTSATAPRVLVCALGGTIAMTDAGQGGVVPTESAASLVAAVPALGGVARVDAMSFRQIPGAHLTIEDCVELAAALRGRAPAYGGIVVTQGTDTIEETSFALDMLWEGDTPLVVTGAMRNPTLPGSDGPANLLAAVRVAASDVTRGNGCVVVMGDEIHAALLVQKRHTTRPSAFTSPAGGAIGVVSERDVHVWADVRRGPRLASSPTVPVPRVALVRLSLGDDGGLLGAVPDLGYEGVVVEAFGGGHTDAGTAELLGAIARTMPVVLASRTGAGAGLLRTYGFPGSERDLLGRGVIPAGTLDGLKARIALTLMLAAGMDRRQVAAELSA